MPQSERFVIGTQRTDISAFADRFEAFCAAHAVPSKVVHAFQVAFDELLTNTIDYALAGVARPLVEVRVRLDDSTLHAEVIDNGAPFDPLSQSAEPDLELDLDERAIGGLGIHLVRNLMDEVRYQRTEPCNHFFMSKRL